MKRKIGTSYISVIFLTIHFNRLLCGPSNPIRTFSILADKHSKKVIWTLNHLWDWIVKKSSEHWLYFHDSNYFIGLIALDLNSTNWTFWWNKQVKVSLPGELGVVETHFICWVHQNLLKVNKRLCLRSSSKLLIRKHDLGSVNFELIQTVLLLPSLLLR